MRKKQISPAKKLLWIYQTMVKIRAFEEEIIKRWPEQEMRSPPHFYMGQEAIAASVCAALHPTDQAVGNYRGHGYYLAKGGDEKAFIAEMYCKKTGSNEGKGGSMLLSHPASGYMGSSALVAGGIPIATGLALASKMRKAKKVVVSFFGDAATEEGVFYESLNFAAIKKLPIVFVRENNFYAVTSHISQRQSRPQSIYKHAEVFGIPSFKIDGNNPVLVYQTAKKAADLARQGRGPTFIEAVTYRWCEHVGEKYDDKTGLRTKGELEYWMGKDPILFLEKSLLRKRLLTASKISQIRNAVLNLVQEAFNYGIKSPLPNEKDLLTNVYPQKLNEKDKI